MKTIQNMNVTEFKEYMDTLDQQENQKAMITIRQHLKKDKNVKWRKGKLRWVKQLIKSLETTTKSRGGRVEKGEESENYQNFIRGN